VLARRNRISVLARRRPAAGAVTMSGVAMTVVLVDDDARYRRVARLALQCEGVSVVAEAADG
jgi:hypothetical protein